MYSIDLEKFLQTSRPKGLQSPDLAARAFIRQINWLRKDNDFIESLLLQLSMA